LKYNIIDDNFLKYYNLIFIHQILDHFRLKFKDFRYIRKREKDEIFKILSQKKFTVLNYILHNFPVFLKKYLLKI